VSELTGLPVSEAMGKSLVKDLVHEDSGELVERVLYLALNGTTAALHCTALYCTALYCTVLYCTVLYCTVLYCTVAALHGYGAVAGVECMLARRNRIV